MTITLEPLDEHYKVMAMFWSRERLSKDQSNKRLAFEDAVRYRLTLQELIEFFDLSTEHPRSKEQQEELEKLEYKILHPSADQLKRVKQKLFRRRQSQGILFARVRLKSTGEVGTGVISHECKLDLLEHTILLDESGELEFCEDLDDLDMLCSNCDGLALKKGPCSGCNLTWYCCEECQREHWDSVHKTKCRKNAPKVPQKPTMQYYSMDYDEYKSLMQSYLSWQH